ncbi:hypothetical protein M8J77_025036 [Diaphorina citri]|nr:hypothetical protein M8J77_025036 [Diaphorina citri]
MFSQFKSTVEEGDTIILYLSPFQVFALPIKDTIKNKHGVEVENIFQTSYGALKVKELIGAKYGSKTQLSRGWGYILYPTPELWTQTLPHRTQIIYTPDISVILMQLELKPGDVVIESGTGSGSLTHSLARAVQKSGHVYTFDFHEDRARLAAEEFSSHGLSQVTCQHRDVVQNGFGEDLHNKADAVFLDLPHPWLAVESAVKSLKPTGGRFCSFSPCIEQVQRTCESLQNLGFVDINTYECLQKEFSVGFRNLPIAEFGEPEDGKNRHKFVSVTPATPTTQGHTGYITSATLPPEAVRLTS